jgi:hypothetical protein
MPAAGIKLRVDGYTASAIEQRCRVAAVDDTKRVVDAAIGRTLEDCVAAIDLDQFKPKRFAHRRLTAARQHRADLLKPIERPFR